MQINLNGKMRIGSSTNDHPITCLRHIGQVVASTAGNTTIANRTAGMTIEFDVTSVICMVTKARLVMQIGNIRRMAKKKVPSIWLDYGQRKGNF